MDNNFLSDIAKELKASSDEKTRTSFSRFFKEDVKFYGVKSATVKQITKKYFRIISGKNKDEILSLCEDLLKTDYCENAFIAFEWSYLIRKRYEESDFQIFEMWIERYVNNWAKCDTLCNHTIGTFIEQYPQYIENLKIWARSDNRWVRRASAVTLILHARTGNFLKEVFEISDILLMDDDDLVQKGYGWMLKETSKKHPYEVFNYVVKNKEKMPRTALRYAIEKLPNDLRTQAMERGG